MRTEMVTGVSIGWMILKKIEYMLHPSMSAASSSSRGIVWRKLEYMKIARGRLNVIWTNMIPQYVLTACAWTSMT